MVDHNANRLHKATHNHTLFGLLHLLVSYYTEDAPCIWYQRAQHYGSSLHGALFPAELTQLQLHTLRGMCWRG